MDIVIDKRAVILQRDEFLQRIVWYPRFERAYKTIKHILEYGGTVEEALILMGPVGAGKSFLLQKIHSNYPIIDTPEMTSRPVLYLRVPPENTLGGMLLNLLDALGDPMPASCSIGLRRLRLKKQIVTQGTRMILLDESQSIVPKDGGDDKSMNIKLLRELMDDLKIPLVLTGKKDVRAILAADDALRSRVRCTLSLDYFSCKNIDDALDFADYMDVLLQMFPRQLHGFNFVLETDNGEISLSQNINNLVRLMLASDGCPRSIRYILKSVIETTAVETVVTTAHFAGVFYMSDNLSKPLNFNPFDAPFAKVKKEAEKRGLYDSDAF
ncbi:hypothetical protein GMES_4396 [Paraglaciecola mesophila KMM 241]|uniref:AAA+ ATPase domain-containing protein n=1 Tax=Paraglaciecola mesophila KMM 241 TaxID=1128912 RepID=K6Z8F0_9ALTE|nr:TniB family NTP-binding protein [Paraglaciecola mesophila]GAC26662.1 hypothetical protein GMES_4396 [Paraglaciecola mesophila KMM 241]